MMQQPTGIRTKNIDTITAKVSFHRDLSLNIWDKPVFGVSDKASFKSVSLATVTS